MPEESNRYNLSDRERLVKAEQEIRFLKEQRRELLDQVDGLDRRVRDLESFRIDLRARLSSTLWWLSVLAASLATAVSFLEHLFFK